MKNQKSKGSCAFLSFFQNSPLKVWDYLIFAAFFFFFFLTYEMGDLFHTAGCSYGFLDGHFLDFYDYLSAAGTNADGSVGIHASYLPPVYLLFAIWNIPMKLLGIVPSATTALTIVPLMWAKILPCLAYLYAGYVVYQIALEFGMGDQKSKLCMYAFLTMPVAFYIQIGMGQYESFTMLFILLGFWMWLKKKEFWFVFWFSIAISFKYTALVAFIPLLLIRDKNVIVIGAKFVASFAFTAIWYLIYHGSEVFNAYVFGIGSEGDNPMGYLFNVAFNPGYTLTKVEFSIYPLFLIFAGICAYGYFKDNQDDVTEKRQGLFLVGLVFSVYFTLTKWHPQWLLLAIPFFVISSFLMKKSRVYLLLDVLMMGVFLIFTTQAFQQILDETMIENGIFKYLLTNHQLTRQALFTDYYGLVDGSMALSLFSAIWLVYGVFKAPMFFAADASEIEPHTKNYITLRFVAGLMLVVIPTLLVLAKNVNPRNYAYSVETISNYMILEENETYVQNFEATEDKLTRFEFEVGCRGDYTNCLIYVTFIDEKQEAIYQTTVKGSSVFDAGWVRKNVNIPLEVGKNYGVQFQIVGNTTDNWISLLSSLSMLSHEEPHRIVMNLYY